MDLRTDNDGDRRRAEEPIRLDIPPRAVEQRVAGGDEGGEVRHRRAGDEAAAAAGGQVEHIAQPIQRDLLQRGADGRHDGEGAVLIPRTRQPIGGERGGQRPAGDEAEIPPAGGGDRRGGADIIEQGEDGGRIGGAFRQWPAEGMEPGHRLRRRADAPLRQPREIPRRPLARHPQHVIHTIPLSFAIFVGGSLPEARARA